MENGRLKELVTASAVAEDGQRTLACAEAFRLASECGVGLPEITRICNAGKIKITKCQLGCF
ncbi:MAG: hypothetical protein KKE37_07590 [Verrucomicrobia bacterium]|nr:hypothetical protein [Verrucomicrobiota bacterium]MBU4291566.1 hypothetical protein [Verrucomicrobiota bacterium]MBU4429199.1 hypothetical protein [Verrucomicrobiota bacterium]MCG2678373.1 hypothetical protein [Kiritimatiellia bacterium]